MNTYSGCSTKLKPVASSGWQRAKAISSASCHGWIEETANAGETPESNCFGYISDICVMPAFKGSPGTFCMRSSITGVRRLRITAFAANKSA
jgi:hypothetical protein